MNPKNKSKITLTVDESYVTEEEFLKNFKQVLDIFANLKTANEQQRQEMLDLLNRKIAEIDKIVNSDIKTIKSEILDYTKQILNTLQKQNENELNFIRDKVRNLQNGKDADETKIIQNVLSQIQLPEQKDVILDTPLQIRDKLETLEGDEKLAIDAIRDLRKELDELKKQKLGSTHIGGIRYLAGTGVTIEGNVISTSATTVGYQVPTGTVDGSNKTFVFTSAPNVIVVDGLTLRKTQADGTANWTGTTTITLTIAPTYEVYGVA